MGIGVRVLGDNKPDFVACVEMIRTLGSHLQALHIHDNTQRHDSYQIPFSMQIPFLPIIQVLKDIGYQGYFTLEANQYLSASTPETVTLGIAKLVEAAHRFEDLFWKM